jgi:hypothetical protein
LLAWLSCRIPARVNPTVLTKCCWLLCATAIDPLLSRVPLCPFIQPSFVSAMTSLQGQSFWAVRLSHVEADDWVSYTLGDPVGNPGGTAQVYRVDINSTPPLLAKMFHSDSILKRLSTNPGYAQRLMCLGLFRDELSRDLPFSTWPRRVVFYERAPADDRVTQTIVGLTVSELLTHYPLSDVIGSIARQSG